MRKRILVVDDDQTLRSLMQQLLEDEAYEVDTAIDGLDALDKLDYQRNVYDVILLDLTMPRLNGLQLLCKVQEQNPILLRSIIAISGEEEALQQAACVGICSTLKKPFDLEVLLALVVRAMRWNVDPNIKRFMRTLCGKTHRAKELADGANQNELVHTFVV